MSKNPRSGNTVLAACVLLAIVVPLFASFSTTLVGQRKQQISDSKNLELINLAALFNAELQLPGYCSDSSITGVTIKDPAKFDIASGAPLSLAVPDDTTGGNVIMTPGKSISPTWATASLDFANPTFINKTKDGEKVYGVDLAAKFVKSATSFLPVHSGYEWTQRLVVSLNAAQEITSCFTEGSVEATCLQLGGRVLGQSKCSLY